MAFDLSCRRSRVRGRFQRGRGGRRCHRRRRGRGRWRPRRNGHGRTHHRGRFCGRGLKGDFA